MKRQEEVRFMADGTNVEYTISGAGTKLLLIHGSQRTKDEFASLTNILEKHFTVYAVDRRGWGNSGTKGRGYSMDIECADAIEFMEEHGIDSVFGDEYGGIIALHVALRCPVKKIVLFEPHLTSLRNLNWISKMERQVARDLYFDAMVTFVKGTNMKTKFVPGFFLKFMFKHSSFSIDRDKQAINKIIGYDDPEQDARNKKDIESAEWKQKKRMLEQVPAELTAAQKSEAELSGLSETDAQALIICERDSEPYVYDSAANLFALIPNSTKIVVDMSGDENRQPLIPEPPKFDEAVIRFLSDGGDGVV